MKERIPIIFFRIVLSAVILYLIFRKISNNESFEVYHFNLTPFILAAVVTMFTQFLGAWKWRILANSAFGLRLSFQEYFRCHLIGVFYGMFAPGGTVVGEVMKGFRIMKSNNVKSLKSELVTSQFMDRITGLVILAAMTIFGFLFQTSLWTETPVLIGLGLSILVILIGSLLLFCKRCGMVLFFIFDTILESLAGHLAFMNRLMIISTHLREIFFHYYQKQKTVINSILIGFGVHILASAGLWLLFRSSDVSVSFFSTVWIYASFNILMFLPISYGGFGIREGVFVYFLGLTGTPPGLALWASFLFFVIQAMVAFLGGLFEVKAIWHKR